MNWYKKAQEIKNLYFTSDIIIEKPDFAPSYSETIIKAFDKESNKQVGYVKYDPPNKNHSGNYAYIYYIKVDFEYTQKGVGSKLIEEIMEKENIQYGQINWGPITHDGQKLKHGLDQKYGPANFPVGHTSN